MEIRGTLRNVMSKPMFSDLHVRISCMSYPQNSYTLFTWRLRIDTTANALRGTTLVVYVCRVIIGRQTRNVHPFYKPLPLYDLPPRFPAVQIYTNENNLTWHDNADRRGKDTIYLNRR